VVNNPIVDPSLVDLSRSKSLRTLKVQASPIVCKVFAHLFSTTTSSVFSKAVVIYQELDVHGLTCPSAVLGVAQDAQSFRTFNRYCMWVFWIIGWRIEMGCRSGTGKNGVRRFFPSAIGGPVVPHLHWSGPTYCNDE